MSQALGVFGLSVEEKIAKYSSDNFTNAPYTYETYLAAIKAILPVYDIAILQKGFSPFSVETDEGNASGLIKYIYDLTKEDMNLIGVLLTAVEQMAKFGQIDWAVYVPSTPQKPSLISQILPAVTQPATDLISSSFTKVLLVGGAVILLYFLGKDYIHHGTKN